MVGGIPGARQVVRLIHSRGWILLLPAMLVLAGASCEGGHARTLNPLPATQQAALSLQKYEFVQPKMGTGFRLVIYASDPAIADRAAAAAWVRVDELNAILSDYDPQSELSRLAAMTDAGPMDRPIKVSQDLWQVLSQAAEAAQRSDGAFDVTIGPLLRLWRRSRDLGQLPTEERLARARESVGARFLKLDPTGHTVQLLAAKMRLDVGGLAKGYTAAAAVAAMRQAGVPRAACGAAGDFACGDPPPGASWWRVGMQSLESPDKVDGYVAVPAGWAVSTGGDTYRYAEIGGVRYSHIIDPRTGLGLTRRIGVTAIAPDGITADWLETAISVMGPETGLPMVEKIPGAAARVTTLDGNRRTVVESSRFANFKSAVPDGP